MRFLLVWLVLLTAAPAAAQTQDRLAPLPSGPATLDWVRQRLKEALGDVTRLEPGTRPSLIYAHTDKADLPRFTISVAEEPGSKAPHTFAQDFVSSFRQSCGPVRWRGELYEGDFAFGIHTVDCPSLGAAGLHIWMMTYRDGARSQLIALSADLAKAAAIDARGDAVARAVGIKLYQTPRTLAEAMAVAQAFGGNLDQYEPAKLSMLDPTRAVLKVDALVQNGAPGTYEIDVRSCNSIRLREVEDSTRRTLIETEIDLQRFAALVTRDGPDMVSRAGQYGEETRYPAQAAPVRGNLQIEMGQHIPDSTLHGMIDAYLLAWERFCRPNGAGASGR